MKRAERTLRQSIIDHCLWMNSSGLNQSTSGNISARFEDTLIITPSGVPYEDLDVGDLAALSLSDENAEWSGPLPPSSEWHFHADLMKKRPDVQAVVHTHSTYATTLAMTRREIPACHYMIAAAGGNTIRCSDYATFGTPELSKAVLEAMEERLCCLMANHGMVATGLNLKKAMWLAVELETLAQQYYLSLVIGGPTILPDDEIDRVKEKFKSYGLKQKS